MDIRVKAGKMELYDNRVGRLSCKQVRAQTGADYVLNCVAFNFSTFQPVMGLRMAGRTLVLDDDYLGLSWNSGGGCDAGACQRGQGQLHDLCAAGEGRSGTEAIHRQRREGQPPTDSSGGVPRRDAVAVRGEVAHANAGADAGYGTGEGLCPRAAAGRGWKHLWKQCGGGSDDHPADSDFLCIWEDRSVGNGVSRYSKKKDGTRKVAANFTVNEFACKDGTDEVLIADKLPEVLQKIRAHFGRAATITSGYRTERYNVAVGGAKASQHCLGTAADIVVTGATPAGGGAVCGEAAGRVRGHRAIRRLYACGCAGGACPVGQHVGP